MSKDSGSSLGNYFELPNPGLRSYFDRVRKGQSEIYRTTFAKGKVASDVLREWRPKLDTLSDRWPTLVEFEDDLAKKVGPMSVMKPLDERMSDLDHYYADITLSAEPIASRAIKAVINEWDVVRGIQIRSQAKTVLKMRLSTNSGSPYFTKRRKVISQSYPVTTYPESRGNWLMEIGSNEDEWRVCAVLGWRGQEGGPDPDDVKQRIVWMFPFSVNIAELQFYQPAIEAAQKFDLVPAWVSMDAVDAHITQMFERKGRDDLVVCTDFTRFDQHFNDSLQEAGKSIIAALLNTTELSSGWLRSVFPIKYSIPMMFDIGKLRFGPHGMGSGSGGTNFDETIVHRALQYEAAQSVNQRLNPYSQCLGDDGIITFPGITVDTVVKAYSSHGLEMNTDKQYASTDDCTYLRRWHHKDYRPNGECAGVYSTCRALGRLMYQERYYDPEVWSAKMVALRQLSIIENCRWHPLRDEFAEFCMKRDMYRLGLDIPGFLDNIEYYAREAMDVMPDFLGYTKTMQSSDIGISKWWIVNYLKSK